MKKFGGKGILNDPDWQNIKDAKVKNITVRHLLEHSGGWNRTLIGDYVFMNLTVAAAMAWTIRRMRSPSSVGY